MLHPIHTENTIQIQQVANGWMVILPFMGEDLEMQKAVRMARVIKKEGLIPGQDEKMEAIRMETEYVLPALKDMKVENIHFFKKFSEVLAFLKLKVDE